MRFLHASVVNVLLVAAGLGLSACGSSNSSYDSGNPPSGGVCPGGGTPVATTSVTVADYKFEPACISVSAGSTVTWTNQGMPTHTVTSETGAPVTFDSGALGSGGTFSFTFANPGTVNYFCIPHKSLGMVGTVIVQ